MLPDSRVCLESIDPVFSLPFQNLAVRSLARVTSTLPVEVGPDLAMLDSRRIIGYSPLQFQHQFRVILVVGLVAGFALAAVVNVLVPRSTFSHSKDHPLLP